MQSRLNGQAYYDTVLDITWLTDANYFLTTHPSQNGTGKMTWADALSWALDLEVAGYDDWRLPRVNPVNGTDFNFASTRDGSTDLGYNISHQDSAFPFSTASELAYMFYINLGNTGAFDVNGDPTGCASIGSFNCLTNVGPFVNLESGIYWTDTVIPYSERSFALNTGLGYQLDETRGINGFAWAVRNGDVSAVPVPAAIWLFSTGLIGIFGIMRKKMV